MSWILKIEVFLSLIKLRNYVLNLTSDSIFRSTKLQRLLHSLMQPLNCIWSNITFAWDLYFLSLTYNYTNIQTLLLGFIPLAYVTFSRVLHFKITLLQLDYLFLKVFSESLFYVLKNLGKFTGKHLCQSLFYKLALVCTCV